MTMTALDRALVAGDAGRVAGDGRSAPIRRSPNAPRTFTAQYKQEVLAAYEAAPDGRKARSCAGKACTPASFRVAADAGCRGPGTGARPGLRPTADAQIARLQTEKAKLEQVGCPAFPGQVICG